MPLALRRLDDTITILNAELVEGAYGSEERNWAAAEPGTVEQAAVWPLSSSEDVVLAERTETRWRVLLRPQATVDAASRVRWDDGDGPKTYEIDGDIERHRRRGRPYSAEAVLLLVQGG